VAPDDWFRSPLWDTESQADFERRLERARLHNRSQYLKIKALALEGSEPRAAEVLYRRVVDEYPESLDAIYCRERIGDIHWQRGERADAEVSHRSVLARGYGLSPSGSSGGVNLTLAELLLESPGREDDVLEQLNAAASSSGMLTLHFHRFRWEAALAIVSDRLGERDTSKKAAQRALDILEAADQFSRHPGVGRAVAPAAQIKMLRKLAK
jgi:hypothetical protein